MVGRTMIDSHAHGLASNTPLDKRNICRRSHAVAGEPWKRVGTSVPCLYLGSFSDLKNRAFSFEGRAEPTLLFFMSDMRLSQPYNY